MQLFALNEQNQVVQAHEAAKRQNYICIECQDPLRVRGGEIRQAHFYHVRPNQKCSLHKKSLRHLQVQWRLRQSIGPSDCQLERPFPSVKRIADVVWTSEKVVFEVQCSPITAAEVLQRNRDYGSLGYCVVWVLHDSRYNQWRVTAAENALRGSPHYFTDIDRNGEGAIYDQYAYIHLGVRREVGGILPVDILGIKRGYSCSLPMPRVLRERVEKWPICFSGDLSFDFAAALQIEKRWDLKLRPAREGCWWRKVLRRFVIRPYLSLFRYCQDGVCD